MYCVKSRSTRKQKLRIQHTLDRCSCVIVKYLANVLHTIRFSSVAMIYFRVVKTEQLETETETETLKFESRDVSRPRPESRELHWHLV